MEPNSSNNSRELQPLSLPLPDHSPSQDDFLDHMLSALPSSWPLDLTNPKSPWDPSADDPLLLASRLRHHQISPPSSKPMVLQLNQQHQQLLVPSMARSGEPALIPLSLGAGNDPREGVHPNANPVHDGLYNGFGGSTTLQRVGSANQQHFAHAQATGALPSQNYGAPGVGMGQGPTASASSGGGGGSAAAGGTGPPRQRVRARRGQATDPHSIAERLRRERIAERMKALQELVPNANKTDKASMLDEIIDYVKFLQLQVKVLSMSRLGAAAAVAPLMADMPPEGASGGPRAATGVNHRSAAGGGGSDSLTVTEHQVAKLMEEDMGSAMQYLQGKGLCLMPISLASAISTATGHPRALPPLAAAIQHHHVNAAKQQLLHAGNNNNADGSSSPSMSVLTVQSAMATTNGAAEADASRTSGTGRDAGASVSKP